MGATKIFKQSEIVFSFFKKPSLNECGKISSGLIDMQKHFAADSGRQFRNGFQLRLADEARIV